MLFVHGIGNQKRGETLEEFGGSLVDRARQWLGADDVRDVPSACAGGDPSPAHGDRDVPSAFAGGDPSPAHRVVDVDRSDGDTLRLLLAESHWADQVKAPSWGVLMRWLGGTVPFVVQRAADAWMRRLSRRVDDVRTFGSGSLAPVLRLSAVLVIGALRVAANVAAVALAAVVVLLLLALGLLARLEPVRDACFGNGEAQPFSRRAQVLAAASLVPIVLLARSDGPPAVALAVVLAALPAVVLLSLAGRVRSLVVSFIGDTYALLNDSGPAIEGRVEGDLAWLLQRAGGAPVVVVAHSQGAEVAHRVLAARGASTTTATAPVVDSLITFGSGIAKLHATDMLRGRRPLSACALGLRAASAACACSGVVAVAGAWDAPLAPYGGPALLLLAAGLLTGARKMLQTIVGDERAAIRIDARAVAHWTDLHASHDPVSEGRLPIPDHLGDSHAIVNRRSLVLDHVTYWGNAEGFQSIVALEIERAADGLPEITVPEWLVAATRTRTYAVDRVVMARGAAAAFACASILTLHPAFGWAAAIVAGAVALVVVLSKLIYADVARRADALAGTHGRQAPRRSPTAA